MMKDGCFKIASLPNWEGARYVGGSRGRLVFVVLEVTQWSYYVYMHSSIRAPIQLNTKAYGMLVSHIMVDIAIITVS